MSRLEELINWLGPEGAIAGLERSDLTVADLMDLVPQGVISQATKVKRLDLIHTLVNLTRKRLTKSTEELMEMDAESLKSYFHEVKASRAELLDILLALDIRPGSAAKKSLAEYAAREISDIGMYRRISKGGAGRS